jgi:hypothetical protein
MTNEEFEIIEAIEDQTGQKAENKTKAGRFIETVVGLLRKIGKGKVTELLLQIIPILLARIASIETKINDVIKAVDKKS